MRLRSRAGRADIHAGGGELRGRFSDRGAAEEIGPRRGITALAQYLDEQRALGRVRRDADTTAVAQLLTGVAYQRAALIRLSGPGGVPSGGVDPIVDTLLAGTFTHGALNVAQAFKAVPLDVRITYHVELMNVNAYACGRPWAWRCSWPRPAALAAS